MQYLLMLFADETAWHRMSSAEQQRGVAAYQAYTEALKEAGAWVGSNRLQNTNTATTVRVADGKSQVLDGPYADSKEQLAGYYLIEAADLDAALSWAARCPGASHGTIEVRPVWPTYGATSGSPAAAATAA
ncbi:YciI family protein [Dyella sp.]|uniref:YciI family protein n=1 Tax=Dyella sp. TaxID=1869338 RepID=UPI002D775B0D|nr:YciI family protein [Dyella sp.]HET7330033.1 YciI family protein [Dyella sp.]